MRMQSLIPSPWEGEGVCSKNSSHCCILNPSKIFFQKERKKEGRKERKKLLYRFFFFFESFFGVWRERWVVEGSIYEAGSSAPSKKPKQNPLHLLRPGNHTSNPGVIPKRAPCGCLSLAADDPQEYCVNSDHPSSTGQHRCVNCGFLACQLCTDATRFCSWKCQTTLLQRR